MIAVGAVIDVRARAVAHGGSMLAEIIGEERQSTVFLRHALPGERGTARVTAVRRGGRLLFADLIEVSDASSDRVASPCRFSGPGGCGGCDFQHVTLPAQRELKAAVIDDCLRRIAQLDPADLPWDGSVHAVPGDSDGLRWRTRSRFGVSEHALAMQQHRSHRMVAIDDCLIADLDLVQAASEAAALSEAAEVTAVCSSTGEVLAGPSAALRNETVRESAGGRVLRVGAEGFWQVHPGAPEALLGAVATVLQPRPTDVLVDLYAGVGLFGATLGGPGGVKAVHLVEGDARAARQARTNLAAIANARVHHRAVLPWLRGFAGPADIVVLDPPRSGAGAEVLREIDRLRPRALAYVACDPAALARDLRTLHDCGWRVTSLRAFDLFPMTHHIECVAGLSWGA